MSQVYMPIWCPTCIELWGPPSTAKETSVERVGVHVVHGKTAEVTVSTSYRCRDCGSSWDVPQSCFAYQRRDPDFPVRTAVDWIRGCKALEQVGAGRFGDKKVRVRKIDRRRFLALVEATLRAQDPRWIPIPVGAPIMSQGVGASTIENLGYRLHEGHVAYEVEGVMFGAAGELHRRATITLDELAAIYGVERTEGMTGHEVKCRIGAARARAVEDIPDLAHAMAEEVQHPHWRYTSGPEPASPESATTLEMPEDLSEDLPHPNVDNLFPIEPEPDREGQWPAHWERRDDGVMCEAVIVEHPDGGSHRYRLQRVWNPARPRLGWVMLNPSTAGVLEDDPTIRRCVRFARDRGFGGIWVVNLYSWRATDPSDVERLSRMSREVLPRHRWPDNERTDFELEDVVAACPLIVCAWGARPFAETRADEVVRILQRAIEAKNGRGDLPGTTTLVCLGRTQSGAPRHPLYLRHDTPFESYP